RRRLERGSPVTVPSDQSISDDLLTILDEELQRLPADCRAPLLACYHRGRTQDEAARELGWSGRTVRRRVGPGRGLLGVRRVRRGGRVWGGLLAGGLVPTDGEAALRDASLTGVLTGPVQPTVAALADLGARTLWANLRRTLTVALTAAALIIGVGVLAR